MRARSPTSAPCSPTSTLTARDFFWDAPHRAAGPVRQLGSPLRLSRTPPRRGAAAPMLGEHTRDALRETGYTDGEIDALVAARAAAVVGMSADLKVSATAPW